MKTQFLAVCALLFTITTALAQTNNGSVNVEERPAVILPSGNWRLKVGDAPLKASRGDALAELFLENDGFFCRVNTMSKHFDPEVESVPTPSTSIAWRISLPGTAKGWSSGPTATWSFTTRPTWCCGIRERMEEATSSNSMAMA